MAQKVEQKNTNKEEYEVITSEELFDIWHLQQNLADIEVHATETGDMALVKYARSVRHQLNKKILGDAPANPQYLCTYKHLLSARMELMELCSKWHSKGDDEWVSWSHENISHISDVLLDTIGNIREIPLKIDTD